MQSGNHFRYLPGSASSQERDTVSVLMEQSSLLSYMCLKPSLENHVFLWKNQLAPLLHGETNINFSSVNLIIFFIQHK